MNIKQLIPILRQNVELELNAYLSLTEQENQVVFACYDRAVTRTLLDMLSDETPVATNKPKAVSSGGGGPKAGSQEARDRAAKAQETRKKNLAQKKLGDTGNGVQGTNPVTTSSVNTAAGQPVGEEDPEPQTPTEEDIQGVNSAFNPEHEPVGGM